MSAPISKTTGIARFGKAKGLIVPALILVLWEVSVHLQWMPSTLLAPPEKVVTAFWELAKTGDLWNNLGISFYRVVKGFLLGTSLGFAFGILLGVSKQAEELIGPTLHGIRQVPLLGWMPLIILWFGIGEFSKVVFIAIGAFFPTLLNTSIGIRGVSREYLEVGKVYQLSKLRLLGLVIIPAALPSIVSGIRLSIGLSWLLVVGAELIAANSGLGQMMTNAREMFQTDVLMVGILVIGLVGLIIDLTIRRVEARLVAWRQDAK
ncbi:MAG TPA: ABC transporter permease [Verrucomicrobiae bacterium]